MTGVRLPPAAPADALWSAVAQGTLDWAAEHALALADVVVLAPGAQHIACALAAFSKRGAELPRIETVRTLAVAVAPPAVARPGALSLDVATDRLVARRALPRRFGGSRAAAAHAAASVVATAHAFAAASAAVPPARRPAQLARWRHLLTVGAGAHGDHEQALARMALDWAAEAPAPATDALHGLRPAGWVLVHVALPEVPPSLPASLVDAADGVPTLRFDAALDSDAQSALARQSAWTVTTCRDFEDEAERSAAAVIAHLNAGRAPVALVSQDRLIVRRVQALLARQHVPIQDETGWTLSTTRAAASLRSVLRCARHAATCDDWLDWLKSCPDAPEADVSALEGRLRRHGLRVPARVDAAALPAAAGRLWLHARRVIATFSMPPRRPLAVWHDALGEALVAFGLGRSLANDAAGEQLLRTLRLAPPRAPASVDPGWQIDLATYAEWIETGMEQATFLPPVDGGVSLPVVITPLARAAWRPFAAIVVPGADGASLGPASAPSTLFGQAETVLLGLPGRDAAQARQRDAIAQLLRQPQVDFLRRAVHEGSPWPPSPALQWLASRRGSEPTAAADARVERRVPFEPIARPGPRAASLLPDALSASACVALRACPYRFYALRLLRLNEADELDTEGDKRDYGRWLHAVLHSFHAARAPSADPAADEAVLRAYGERTTADVEPEDFVPFMASFARFVPRYLAWLAAHEATGARWLAGEAPLTARPAAWEGTEMVGTLDRIDLPAAGSGARHVIDYKTGGKERLRSGIGSGEDVQLPFYAGLMAAQPDVAGPVRASYLLLDESDGIAELDCAEAELRGDVLVEGIGEDLRRLRAGAAMRALGEGDACTHCAARGLCRRDHWAPPATAPSSSDPAA